MVNCSGGMRLRWHTGFMVLTRRKKKISLNISEDCVHFSWNMFIDRNEPSELWTQQAFFVCCVVSLVCERISYCYCTLRTKKSKKGKKDREAHSTHKYSGLFIAYISKKDKTRQHPIQYIHNCLNKCPIHLNTLQLARNIEQEKVS